MQKLMSVVRRCIDDYQMIKENDSIAVGVSGGKDSMTLLCVLAGLKEFYPLPFTLKAVTLDLGFGADFDPIRRYCDKIGVELIIRETQIGKVIFEERKESNPCSMCSKMRRGALNEMAKSIGCDKIALGHHFDDAVETFMLSLIYEGRLSCFEPVTWLSRMEVTQIRPLLYLNEHSVASFAQRYELPIVKNPCPADSNTKRQEVKDLLSELQGRYPGLKNRIFSSIQRLPLKGWEPVNYGRGRKCDMDFSDAKKPSDQKQQP